MAEYLGSCLCGGVKFEVQGEFESFFLCHCRYCQKDTGSAHAANLFAQSAKLVWLAGAEEVVTFTLPGTRHKKAFCRCCGSALPSTHDVGMLAVPAGCLDTDIKISPTANIFTSSKARWVKELDLLPKFDTLPE